MNPFKINFSKLLKSTAIALLFIPGVSAMVDDNEGWEEHRHLLTPSPSSTGDEGPSSSSAGRASTSSPSILFTKSEPDWLGQTYSRLNVGTSAQYEGLHLPQAPVIHPYTMAEPQERTNFGVPSFPYAARQSAGELDPNLFPALSEAQATLRSLGADPETADYFYVVQNDPWNDGPWFYQNPKTKELIETKRLLRPQYWAFPDVLGSSKVAYEQNAGIKVGILSPNNSVTLSRNLEGKIQSEGPISSHNGINKENPNGIENVVSSGPAFPMLDELKANQTSFFVSTVVIPTTKRAAVTFHTILDDTDFDLLQRIEINTLPELQYWLGNLFQNKYGVAPDSSSPYSNWTTRAGSSSSSSSSTLAPVDESVLHARATTFQMGESSPYLSSGFSVLEGSHRWTVGKKASITLPLAEMAFPSRISFSNTRGLVTASHSQDLIVKMNGKEVGHYAYTPGNNNQTIDIPLPKDVPLATIEFEIPKAASPSELGINPDKRELGISFRDVQFHY
ncbi:MAG: hypothetical protein K2X02_04395 [Alphaproteobacteria bacterium]|nr:hypothetical protein [Alphaproteobacteria bacterium]